MNQKIDVWLDVVSPYSLFAYKYVLDNRPLLNAHGVDIKFHPFFLGGANVATGNKPPWTLPAKAAYSPGDRKRACAYFGVKYVETPSFFPILSIFPQRVIVYLQENHPPAVWERAWMALWVALWEERLDVSQPAILAEVLAKEHILKEESLKSAIQGASNDQIKQKLTANTEEAVKLGAFGAPWFVVQNATGVTETFFGSDRFTYMWKFLGLPIQDLQIKAPSGHSVNSQSNTQRSVSKL